jgi:hypothetical protein
MKKGDDGKKVLGVIVILAIIVSIFGGVVSAEDLSGGLKQSVDDAELRTAIGNLSSEELTKSTALDKLGAVTDGTVNIEFANQSAERGKVRTSQCGDQIDDCPCGMPNPYPCCDNDCDDPLDWTDVCDGNCCWWAWDQACCNWGVGLPGWGSAKIGPTMRD